MVSGMSESILRSDDRRLVTIAAFPTHVQASIARNVLEAEGIPACLGAENASTLLTYYGTAIGGVKLLVFADQTEKSKALLSIHSSSSQDIASDNQTPQDENSDESPELRERNAQISRAWSAAVLGLILCPPAMSIFSMHLLIRHELMRTNYGPWRDWRINASLLLNAFSILVISWLVWVAADIQSPFFLWHE